MMKAFATHAALQNKKTASIGNSAKKSFYNSSTSIAAPMVATTASFLAAAAKTVLTKPTC